MRADNSRHVVAAARRRSEDTTRRAVAALRQMDTAGAVITFDSVARHADVSRAWLYTQPELRAEIERLRQNPTPPNQRRVPDRQRGSDASLHQRLQTALVRIRQLEADNRRLSAALAQALGHNRSNPTPIPPPAPPTPLPPTASQRPAVNHG